MNLTSEKISEDPILNEVGSEPEPETREILKGEARGESDVGTPAAPRSALQNVSLKRPWSIFQLLGPGLITGASDDDPSGIGTYSQVGSQFGYGLLWTALFTFPLMAAVQEMCSRIALHTGVGLGLALRRKFPTSLIGACILALLIANTINVGADLGAVAAGGSLLTHDTVKAIWLVVPAAALILAL
jgi:Mn2+/Fe2+ NRAMP family transporter